MKHIIITMSFAIAFQITIIWHCRVLRLKAKDLATGGMICALTIILELIMIPIPTGAKITLGAMIPIMLLSIIYDEKLAMLCGLVTGILALFILPNWQPVHWAQVFVEHLVCFTCLGYAGIFKSEKNGKILGGILIAIGIKTIAHVSSGVVFFSENAWDGWSAWGYSLAYNLSSMIPEAIGTIIIMMLIPVKNIKNSLQGVLSK